MILKGNSTFVWPANMDGQKMSWPCGFGRAFPSKNYSMDGVKLLRPGNLHMSGSIEWTPENTRYLPKDWAEKHKGYIVGPEELIINLTAQSLKDEFFRTDMLNRAGRILSAEPTYSSIITDSLSTSLYTLVI